MSGEGLLEARHCLIVDCVTGHMGQEYILKRRPMGSIIVLQCVGQCGTSFPAFLHRRGVMGQPSCLLQPIKLGLDACERLYYRHKLSYDAL